MAVERVEVNEAKTEAKKGVLTGTPSLFSEDCEMPTSYGRA